MHVLKGAIERTLGPKHFTSARVEGKKGTLAMRADERPLSQEVAKIEAAGNAKVAEDVEMVEFEMEREEAQGHFGKGIFDLCVAPVGQAVLRIVRIPEWEVACCSERHVTSTGLIGFIRIESTALDQSGRELQLAFSLQ